MGEVWCATDTNLGRQVAIKILPDAFARDPDRLARFEREAKTLASLNHPNVAIIHGLEKAAGIRALVMEFVKGPTLADRIAHGPIPVDEALSIAKQIAEALEAAHEQGIIHRDLKPANIKLRPDGTVKVLDFGLAKVMEPPATTSAGISHSPTITSLAHTMPGVILGTAAYMSPEQARGEPVDKRADIWAFGVVLYEMLSGQRAFRGETNVEVLSNVLKADPVWSVLPPATPAAVRSVLQRCVQKEPARRLRDIADARFRIEEAPSEFAGAAVFVSRRRERLLWAAGALVFLVAGALGTTWLRPERQLNADETRFMVDVPPTTDPSSLAISPDGKQLVFVGTSEGKSRLWLRSLDSVSARPLAGTDNGRFPFWSPNSRSIGFFANGQLKRVETQGGSVQVIVPSGAEGGGTWNRDGLILFDPGAGLSLSLVSADGGAQTTILQGSPHDLAFPQFLPDSRHFLFYTGGPASGIYLGELGSQDPPQKLLDAQAATYAPSGHLLFVRQGTLFAQEFDLAQLKLTGSSTPVVEQIVVGQDPGVAALSVSTSGTVVYRTGPSNSRSQFVWFDRSGNQLEAVAGSDIGTGFNSALSPDASRLALSAGTVNVDVWALDLVRGVPTRLTIDPAVDVIPVWSPDGLRIAFTSSRRMRTEFDLFVRPASATGGDELLIAMDGSNETPSDWSDDGQFILVTRDRGAAGSDVWAFQLEGRRAFPVVETKFIEGNAQFSPNGRWIAYQSDESGHVEIWVQPFQGPGSKVPVSSGGGIQVRWRQDGREIFYLAPDNRILAVPIGLDSSGDLRIGAPVSLFAPNLSGKPRQIGSRHYEVSPDGQRFLIDTLKEVTIPVTVALNWKSKP